MRDKTSLPTGQACIPGTSGCSSVSLSRLVCVLQGEINCSSPFLTPTLEIQLADIDNAVGGGRYRAYSVEAVSPVRILYREARKAPSTAEAMR